MKYNWNLNHIFANRDEWEEMLHLLEKKLQDFSSILKSKLIYQNFSNVVKQKIEIDEMMEQIYCYPRRHLDLDATNADMQNRFDKALNVYGKVLEIEKKFDKAVLQNKSISKIDIKYKRYVEQILRRHAHQIPEKEASILGEFAKEKDMIRKLFHNLTEENISYPQVTNEKGKQVQLTSRNIPNLLTSPNSDVRRETFLGIMKTYKPLSSTLFYLYDWKVEIECKQAYMEKFDHLLQKKIFMDDLPIGMIDTLLESVQKHQGVIRSYMKSKKEYLGLSELHFTDLMYSKKEDSFSKIEFDEAVVMIKEALSILGSDYMEKIDKALEEGWIDAFPKDHKRKDSYSCISYFGVPYTLINYTGSIKSVRNLCHELGHALHTDYAKTQGFLYFEYSLFLSEIASKVNELLLNNYLYGRAKEEEKLYILSEEITSLVNTLYGQTLLTEFENEVFNRKENGGILSSDLLCDIYYKLCEKYYGKECILEDEIRYNWARIPHLYLHESYYVYQYAISLSIACCIVDDIQKNPKGTENYIKFLQTGNHKSIRDSLKIVNIELDNSSYIEKAFTLLDERLGLFKKLLSQKKKD